MWGVEFLNLWNADGSLENATVPFSASGVDDAPLVATILFSAMIGVEIRRGIMRLTHKRGFNLSTAILN